MTKRKAKSDGHNDAKSVSSSPVVFSRLDFDTLSAGSATLTLQPRCHEAGFTAIYAGGLLVLSCSGCHSPVVNIAVGTALSEGPREEVLLQAAGPVPSDVLVSEPEIVTPQKLDAAARRNRARKRK